MHPNTDRATFNAYQDAAERVHYGRSPTPQDYAMLALYEAFETTAGQLKSLALKVALLASEEPSVKAMSKHSAQRRSCVKLAP